MIHHSIDDKVENPTLRPCLGRRGELSGGGQQEQQARGVQQGAADDEGTRDNSTHKQTYCY